MSKFRKIPVVIDAFRFGFHQIPDWAKDLPYTTLNYVNIETIEGVMKANCGDWIIRGVKGELYPCRDDIFKATYEPA